MKMRILCPFCGRRHVYRKGWSKDGKVIAHCGKSYYMIMKKRNQNIREDMEGWIPKDKAGVDY